MRRNVAAVFFIFSSWVAVSQTANAQATRTWVSGVGDDANPCSRTAPCKTFAGAISKTAPSGEINVLDPGGYGAVTITKSITIDGSGGSIAGVLVSGTNGIVINAANTDVVNLRKLDINGVGTGLNGINVLAAQAVVIEHSKIYNFTNYGINFTPTNANAKLLVSDSIISNNTQGGIYVAPAAGNYGTADIDNVEAFGNAWGVGAADRANVTITSSNLSGNAYHGVLAYSASAPTTVNVKRSVTSHNGAYGVVTSGVNAIVVLSQTSSFGNKNGVGQVGGTMYSFGDNQILGNSINGAPNATAAPQ